MQQIFVLVNRLLQSDPTTSKRQLCVRTYKVIPLSQRSGVAEWCENTRPLGEYLVGTPKNPETGAHSRYRPFDLPTLACRKKMMVCSAIVVEGNKYRAIFQSGSWEYWKYCQAGSLYGNH